jgi:hypothetical protein
VELVEERALAQGNCATEGDLAFMPRRNFVVCSIFGLALFTGGCSSDSNAMRPGTGGGDPSGGGGSTGTGGAGTGGGSTDASTGRGGSDAATGEAGAVALVLVDTFEATPANGPPDPTKWTVDLLGGNGVVTVDSTIAHNSTKSLHVNGNASFHTMAMSKGAPLFPAPGNRFFGRLYLRLPGAMPQGHVIWIEAGSVMNDVAETRLGSNIGQLDINRWPNDTEQRAPAGKLTAATWQCFEFMFDGGANEARVWLDGTELTDLHVTHWVAPNQTNGNNNTPILNWAPSYDAVRLGWELGGAEIWFDDVAFAYQRIGCL